MTNRNSLVKQLIVSLVVLVALVVAGLVLARRSQTTETEADAPSAPGTVTVSSAGRRIVQIETTPVRVLSLSGDIQTTGLIDFPSDRTVHISPRVQGRVRRVFVRVGDHVAAGQMLALLDSVDATSALTTLRQNENKLRLAKLNLDRQERLYRLGTPEVTAATATLNQARAAAIASREALERTRRQAGIGGFTQPPVEAAQNALISAKTALVQAQSDLALAERDHDRKVKLVAIGVTAQSDLEASENVLAKARAAVQSDQESLTVAQQALEREQKAYKTNLYADQQVKAAEAAYRQSVLQETAAQTALKLARAAMLTNLEQARSDYQAAQSDAENARRVLTLLGQPRPDGTVPVTAPISGVVTERNVSDGQVVDQSQMTPWNMFTISNADLVWVDADVYEKDIERVAPGQSVAIKVGALPGKAFAGTVLRIAPTVDPKTRAVKVRAEIPNPGEKLKDGMYADMTIIAGRSPRQLEVPLAAVQYQGDNTYVYVAHGKQYDKRVVQLGTQQNGYAIVEKGLQPGERIVTHGALFLGDQNNSD